MGKFKRVKNKTGEFEMGKAFKKEGLGSATAVNVDGNADPNEDKPE
jgi:hypothetical protein